MEHDQREYRKERWPMVRYLIKQKSRRLICIELIRRFLSLPITTTSRRSAVSGQHV